MTRVIVTVRRAGRVRLTLDLSQRLDAELDRISRRGRTTKATVLRTALEFLFAMEGAKEEGFTVGAWKEDFGKRSERVFVLST